MNALMVILQCSWGILQTTLGFFVFVLHGREPHFFTMVWLLRDGNKNQACRLACLSF